MKRRFAYAAVILVWLAIMCFPVLAFALAIKGELIIGNHTRSGLRLFMVQEKTAQGVGIEWSRAHGKDSRCTKTSVKYLLWESDQANPNVDYCLCFEVDAGEPKLAGTCKEMGF